MLTQPRMPSTRSICAGRAVLTLAVLAVTLAPLIARADVVTDGSLGAATSLTGPDFAVTADLGRQRGGNLFHSMSQLNLANGESMTFSGPAEIANIIVRVTGGEISTIDGLLRSDIAGANIYVLNPAGTLFGANAFLEISGSLHVTSADFLILGEQLERFLATPLQGEVLSTAAPVSLGFLGSGVGAIMLQGTQLTLAQGQRLVFVAGEVSMDQSTIIIDDGTVLIGTAQGADELNFSSGLLVSTSAAPVPRGTVALLNQSEVTTDGTIPFINVSTVQVLGADVEVFDSMVTTTTAFVSATDAFTMSNSRIQALDSSGPALADVAIDVGDRAELIASSLIGNVDVIGDLTLEEPGPEPGANVSGLLTVSGRLEIVDGATLPVEVTLGGDLMVVRTVVGTTEEGASLVVGGSMGVIDSVLVGGPVISGDLLVDVDSVLQSDVTGGQNAHVVEVGGEATVLGTLELTETTLVAVGELVPIIDSPNPSVGAPTVAALSRFELAQDTGLQVRALGEVGVTLTPNSGAEVDEAGASDTLELLLTGIPRGDLNVSFTLDDTEGELVGAPTTLSQSDALNPIEIVVRGIPDGIPDGNQTWTLTVTLTSAETDPDFDGQTAFAEVTTLATFDDTDHDDDTVLNADDNCPTVANLNQEDADGDGVGDACDNTDNLDIDDDGVPNADDNCPTVANLNQEDADEDGVGDACDNADNLDIDDDGVANADDNCPTVANLNQEDADGDGVGDACDNTDNLDIDDDGVPNADDNCPTVANLNQEDADGDGVGDACDNTDNLDIDDDGVPNADDNCPTVANLNQEDADEDGVGDACDNADNLDIDDDGVANADDNCPTDGNADQADEDEDGIGDACDADSGGCSASGRSGLEVEFFLLCGGLFYSRRRRRRT